MATAASHDPAAAPFYNELIAVLEKCNAARPPEQQITMRTAIMEGLGLRDSFSGKIKSGQYKPTTERLKNLAHRLGVHPTEFDAYVRRVARERLDESPELLEVFRVIAAQNPTVQRQLERGLAQYIRDVVAKATKAA